MSAALVMPPTQHEGRGSRKQVSGHADFLEVNVSSLSMRQPPRVQALAFLEAGRRPTKEVRVAAKLQTTPWKGTETSLTNDELSKAKPPRRQ